MKLIEDTRQDTVIASYILIGQTPVSWDKLSKFEQLFYADRPKYEFRTLVYSTNPVSVLAYGVGRPIILGDSRIFVPMSYTSKASWLKRATKAVLEFFGRRHSG